MCGGSGKSDGGMERERARAASQVPVGYMAYVYVADSYVCVHVCMCARMLCMWKCVMRGVASLN